MDVPAGVTQEEGNTGFSIHLEIHLHFTTSPQGHSITCIKLLFHRLKIQPLHGITVHSNFITMQGHQNTTIRKGTIR